MIKFLITVVVLAALVGGLWWSGWLTKIIAMIPAQTAAVGATATTTPPVASNTQQQIPNDLPTATNDASDSALAQDTVALDAQIKNLSTDSANSSASLSDKPVTQEY